MRCRAEGRIGVLDDGFGLLVKIWLSSVGAVCVCGWDFCAVDMWIPV